MIHNNKHISLTSLSYKIKKILKNNSTKVRFSFNFINLDYLTFFRNQGKLLNYFTYKKFN